MTAFSALSVRILVLPAFVFVGVTAWRCMVGDLSSSGSGITINFNAKVHEGAVVVGLEHQLLACLPFPDVPYSFLGLPGNLSV